MHLADVEDGEVGKPDCHVGLATVLISWSDYSAGNGVFEGYCLPSPLDRCVRLSRSETHRFTPCVVALHLSMIVTALCLLDCDAL